MSKSFLDKLIERRDAVKAEMDAVLEAVASEDRTDLTADETPKVDTFVEESRENVGDFVEWDSSGGTAKGRIEHIMEEGVLGIPGTEFSITAEEGDPAVLIRVYEEFRDGYRATETLVGHKMSELRYIEPLPEATEEEGRKISLRLAKAIVSNTK